MGGTGAAHNALKRIRPRSHVLGDLRLPAVRESSPRRRARRYDAPLDDTDARRTADAARYDSQLRALSSPLRRCILTGKVLPSDMLVRFELARPRATSDADRKSKPKQHLMLEPSRVLHPRFDPAVAGQGGQTTGKGMWVTCWSDAVAALAKKGSYKRLHSLATMADPPLVCAQVHSQLARRVVQEAELLAERVKSWPAAGNEGPIASWEDVPVRRFTQEELQAGALESLQGAGKDRIVAAFDLSLDAQVGTDGLGILAEEQGPGASGRSAPVPFYRLSPLFRSVLLPPSTPHPRISEGDVTPEARLMHAIRASIDSAFALLARRFARDAAAAEVAPEDAPGPSEAVAPSQGDIFALVAPRHPETEGEQMRAEVVVPLAVALWRLTLWSGQGWKGA